MISPTGLGIRSDSAGNGMFGAKRGRRLHKGTDFICKPGQIVVAPISGRVIRIAKPYANAPFSGLVIKNKIITIKMFYFNPQVNIVGMSVVQGQNIGLAQDIAAHYPDSGMTPHIHLQVDAVDPLLLFSSLAMIELKNVQS